MTLEVIKENQCPSCIFYKQQDDKCVGSVQQKLSNAAKPVNFCQTHRPLNTEFEGEIEDFFKETLEVTSHKFGIVIFDESDSISNIEDTVQSIIDCDYPKSRIKVVISVEESTIKSRGGPEGHALQNYVQYYYTLKRAGIKSEITFHRPNVETEVMETDVFQKLINATHLVNINAGQKIPKDFFRQSDKKRVDMERITLHQDEDTGITSLPIFIARNFYFNYTDYRDMVKNLTKESKDTNTYLKYEKSQ